MINLNYPSRLLPNAIESIQLQDRTITLPKHTRVFPRWTGAPIYDWGGKPLIDYNGVPVFAELATLHLGRQDAWDGRWTETYGMRKSGPLLLTNWIDAKPSLQTKVPIEDPSIIAHIHRIAEHKKGKNQYGGCWDIMFWQGTDVCFYECKRKGKDAIRGTQKEWLQAALSCGYHPEQFVVLEWEFAD